MSEKYPQRGEVELAALTVLERSINLLATDFYRQRALNYFHESELTSYLLSKLRLSPNTCEDVKGNSMHLAHLEWPCIDKKIIDLVLWKPGSCEKAIDLWWNRNNCAKNLPLLAAVQIKRGPGTFTPWSFTRSDLKSLDKLDGLEKLGKPVLYFLEWVDHNIQRDRKKRERYIDLQDKLNKWCHRGLNRRAFVISRDKVGFAYPKGAWLVNPLPEGTMEHLD